MILMQSFYIFLAWKHFVLVVFLDAFFFLCSIYVLVMRIMISYHFGYLRRDSPSKRRTGLSVCTKGQPVIGACSSCIHIPGKWIVALCAQTAGV